MDPSGLLSPWDFLGKNTSVSSHFLLQGIFLTQRLDPCLLYPLHFRWILYHWATCGKKKKIKTMLSLIHSIVFDGSSMICQAPLGTGDTQRISQFNESWSKEKKSLAYLLHIFQSSFLYLTHSLIEHLFFDCVKQICFSSSFGRCDSFSPWLLLDLSRRLA